MTEHWQSEIIIPDTYKHLRDGIVQQLSRCEDKWNRHMDPLKTTRHINKLTFKNIRSVQRTPCCVDKTVRQFPAEKIRNMLHEECIKPADTELARPIVFAPRMDDVLKF